VAKSTRGDAKGPVFKNQFTGLFAENNNAFTTYVAVFAKYRPIINVKVLEKNKLRYDVIASVARRMLPNWLAQYVL
jgi:hypothetical protein